MTDLFPFRYRLAAGALEQGSYAFLDFPWQREFATFTATMEQLRGKQLSFKERMPHYRSLNSTLTLFSPVVHAFKGMSWGADSGDDEGRDPGSQRYTMLTLAQGDFDRFTPGQFIQVAHAWTNQWAKFRFRRELELGGEASLMGLLKTIRAAKPEWQERELGHLKLNDSFFFNLIPSLLATRMHGKTSVIDGQAIEWRLAYDPAKYRLCLVSQPIYSAYRNEKGKKANGYFAYLLRFAAQTQAGTSLDDFWIHQYVSCRRYHDRKITANLFGRNMTVMIGLRQPLLAGWPSHPTVLIPQWLTGKVKENSYDDVRWDNPHLFELWKELGVTRPLEKPADILGDPAAYMDPTDPYADIYLVVHAEGYRPAPTILHGFGPVEARQIFDETAGLLGDILTPGESLPRSHVTLLTKKELRGEKRPLALCHRNEFSGKRQKEVANIVWAAMQKAGGGRPVTLLVFWRTENTRDEINAQVRYLFGLKTDEYPEGFTVRNIQVEPQMTDPLDPGPYDPGWRFQKLDQEDREKLNGEWKVQMRVSHRARGEAWARLLDAHRAEDGYTLAIVELPEQQPPTEEQNPKIAIREAGLEARVGTQGLVSMPASMNLKNRGAVFGDHMNRAKNAVHDALLRQIGAVYGDVRDAYRLIAVERNDQERGLSPEVADNLVVIGLYAHRWGKYRYAMAVAHHPDGQLLACLPDFSPGGLSWQPYFETTQCLGRMLTDPGKLKQITAKRFKGRAAEFAFKVIAERRDYPTLVLLTADDWRWCWPALTNPKMITPDRLDFSHIPNGFVLESGGVRPGLRVIRLRERGNSDETPQYVFLGEDGPDYDDPARLLGAFSPDEQSNAASKFFHGFSVARLPETSKNLPSQKAAKKRGVGALTAFSFPTAEETVAMFLQPGDDPELWSLIAHFQRIIVPHWAGGETVLPYVLHQAFKAFKDYVIVQPQAGEGDVDAEPEDVEVS